MLSIEHLSHHYGDLHVLRDVSLSLAEGELVCLLGPSGCGKTTLLRIAAGIENCQSGEIRLGGEVVAAGHQADAPPEARHVGMMFQDFALFPHLTNRQNMMFGARTEIAARAQWVEATAARMGVGEYLDQYPGTLSGGQQQRVALIRALAPNPNALLLDEPFSGLDTVRRADVREQTRTLIQETGIAALMVTHDPEEAMFMADRLAIMHEGQIIQIGSPDEVYFRPHNAFVASLFGPLNRIPKAHPLAQGLPESRPGSRGAPGDHEPAPELLFRPDNLMEVAAGTVGSCAVHIHQARRLGSEVQLQLTAGENADAHRIQARWPAIELPRMGTTIHVAIRHPEQVFIF
ncbi:MAG: ABC transporter ATP-binding protein [Burkholderiaceae bacterium]